MMWANGLTVWVEVNVVDDWADISLELTTMQASSRATPQIDQSHASTLQPSPIIFEKSLKETKLSD